MTQTLQRLTAWQAWTTLASQGESAAAATALSGSPPTRPTPSALRPCSRTPTTSPGDWRLPAMVARGRRSACSRTPWRGPPERPSPGRVVPNAAGTAAATPCGTRISPVSWPSSTNEACSWRHSPAGATWSGRCSGRRAAPSSRASRPSAAAPMAQHRGVPATPRRRRCWCPWSAPRARRGEASTPHCTTASMSKGIQPRSSSWLRRERRQGPLSASQPVLPPTIRA
mmetsp:Transcript_37055/g.106712  ORF Transcript_37055/g.106712 Transcript_37055/m.106712 type:complete len:227 (-) Transcript_37055:1337-2017(-)